MEVFRMDINMNEIAQIYSLKILVLQENIWRKYQQSIYS